MSELAFLQEHFLKLLISAILGGLVGIERGHKGNSTGLGTLSILTMSCCLITILSIELSNQGEYMRVVAAILSAVGFIGSGAVFTTRNEDDNDKSVKGLTSASIVLFLSIVGITVAVGYYFTAIAVVLMAELAISMSTIIKNKKSNDIQKLNSIEDDENDDEEFDEFEDYSGF